MMVEPSKTQGPSRGPQKGLIEKILSLCIKPKRLAIICKATGFTNRTKFRNNYIIKLIWLFGNDDT